MTKELVVHTTDQIDLIKKTVAVGATDNELKLFLYTAQRTGLDPLTKQIHFVKRGQTMTIQTGIDGYRTVAERSGSLAGIDDVVYDDEKGTHPNKATVTVHRIVEGQKVSFTASARWSEYAPKDQKQAFMWNKMPFLMLGKCAEALALRKAFPHDLSGVYTTEEMAQADVVQTYETKIEPEKLAPKQRASIAIEKSASVEVLNKVESNIKNSKHLNEEEKESLLFEVHEKRNTFAKEVLVAEPTESVAEGQD